MANDMKILPTITTITPGKWRDKVAEVKRLKLKEIAVFPTCLDEKERKEFHSLLKQTGVESVPFVHLRNDMILQEIEYLIKTYGTRFFNIHTVREFASLQDYGRYKKSVYIENTHDSFDEKEIEEFGGTCLDLSHLENDRLLRPEIYEINIKILKKHLPRCSHVAAINQGHHTHVLTNLSELDYLKRYSLEFFGEIAAIELENTIEEQLEAKEYISTLINKK